MVHDSCGIVPRPVEARVRFPTLAPCRPALPTPQPLPPPPARSPKLVMEEAPESYKDVSEVVDTCHEAGISKKTVKLRPIAVVKG